MLISQALDENTWKVNLVITKCCNAHFACWLRHLLRSVAAIKIHLIMREPRSGRSWTSKVFNTVITLDTYQFDISNIIYTAQVNFCYLKLFIQGSLIILSCLTFTFATYRKFQIVRLKAFPFFKIVFLPFFCFFIKMKFRIAHMVAETLATKIDLYVFFVFFVLETLLSF